MFQPYQYMQPMGAQSQQYPSFASSMTSMQQQPSLSGRMVNSVEEVVPNEIPMNGSVAIFPMANMSSIYVKGWNPDGTISTVQYMPVKAEDNSTPSVTLADVMNSLDDIRQLIDEKVKEPKKTTTRSTSRKKEPEDDAE